MQVVFTNAGELDGAITTSVLLNQSLWAAYAQEIKAALVMIERKLMAGIDICLWLQANLFPRSAAMKQLMTMLNENYR